MLVALNQIFNNCLESGRRAEIMFTDLNHLLSLLCVTLDHQGKAFLVSDHCLQHAFSLHHSLCSNLLQAYQGLFGYFTSITKDIPSSHRMELGILQYDFTSTHVKSVGLNQQNHSTYITAHLFVFF